MKRLAIPLAQGQLSMHFGHCDQFALIDVNPETGAIEKNQTVTPPVHAPGVLPRWLSEQGASVILAGGMGQRAQELFTAAGIEVIVGLEPASPEHLANDYLTDSLRIGTNLCDH